MVDTIWLGRLSTEAVAAVGICSFFIWFANAVVLISRIGLTTWVSRSYGENEMDKVEKYIKNSFQLSILLAVIYSSILFIFKRQFIGFYNLDNLVSSLAIEYTSIIAPGLIFSFLNPMFAGTYNSFGNSVTPFKISAIGLIINIILDPIFIFTLNLGIAGAAYATVLAQFIVTLIYIYSGKKGNVVFTLINYLEKPDFGYMKQVFITGYPAAIQSGAHGVVNMILNKFVASYGAMPVAVYSVASQIESVCWMTAEGFSTALTSFMGQNLGNRNFDRLREGYKEGMKLFAGIGILSSILLIFFGGSIFKVFLPDDLEAIKEGTRVLFAFGLFEWAMAIEIGTVGAFNGIGLTLPPAIAEVILNIIRIPIALVLMPILGVLGVWVSMSASMALKGIVLFTMFVITMKKTNGFKSLVEY
ncbi:MAG: MATE family efflux transporter [Tissierellia bacterium]|nr:MATE family efflux transporter [Tissierellia bacterium]